MHTSSKSPSLHLFIKMCILVQNLHLFIKNVHTSSNSPSHHLFIKICILDTYGNAIFEIFLDGKKN